MSCTINMKSFNFDSKVGFKFKPIDHPRAKGFSEMGAVQCKPTAPINLSPAKFPRLQKSQAINMCKVILNLEITPLVLSIVCNSNGVRKPKVQMKRDLRRCAEKRSHNFPFVSNVVSYLATHFVTYWIISSFIDH